ncbi:MAG TPA: hypothetical protein VNX18_22545 [Bryobacteraceae bacterium]|nr:hypothetical protein [Bryobacteraceae bacterium]
MTTTTATVCLGYIAMLVVQSNSEAEAVTQCEQMASGAATKVDHTHPFRDHIVENVEFGAQERLDRRRLCSGIERPSQ